MKKKLLVSIIALVLLTAILSVIHLTTRTPDAEGAILVNGETVRISELQLSPVKGTVINAKGEEKEIDAEGVHLSDVCGDDFETVTVTASDEYHATVAKSEAENAYIIIAEDGSVQLVVFGDDNLKRNVKNVVRADTE